MKQYCKVCAKHTTHTIKEIQVELYSYKLHIVCNSCFKQYVREESRPKFISIY